MRKHNYYPLRSQFMSSNGIFFSMNELKQQMEEKISFKATNEVLLSDLPFHSWIAAPDVKSPINSSHLLELVYIQSSAVTAVHNNHKQWIISTEGKNTLVNSLYLIRCGPYLGNCNVC
jgi:hypothetical protein